MAFEILFLYQRGKTYNDAQLVSHITKQTQGKKKKNNHFLSSD